MLITYCSCSPVVLGSSKALVLSFTTSSAGQLPSAGNRFIWIWVFVMRRQRVKWMQLWQPDCYHFKQLQPVFKQVMVHVTVACRQYNVWKNEAFILATISVKQVVRHAWSPYFSFQWDIQTMPISRFRFVQPIRVHFVTLEMLFYADFYVRDCLMGFSKSWSSPAWISSHVHLMTFTFGCSLLGIG